MNDLNGSVHHNGYMGNQRVWYREQGSTRTGVLSVVACAVLRRGFQCRSRAPAREISDLYISNFLDGEVSNLDCAPQ